MARGLGRTDTWKFEIAAQLSQIGCVAVPPEALARMHAGDSLEPHERAMVDGHSQVGHDLLASIPRMAEIAQIIRTQSNAAPPSADPEVVLGGRMLRVALALDAKIADGKSLPDALAEIQRTGTHDPTLVELLRNFRGTCADGGVKSVSLSRLHTYMVLEDDVRTRTGSVAVSRGTTLTAAIIQRLRNFALGSGIVEPIHVRVRGAGNPGS
jgi:HD-GYP domain-containing protein (c-di-GMP phosphodiesterase class II)